MRAASDGSAVGQQWLVQRTQGLVVNSGSYSSAVCMDIATGTQNV